MMKRVVFLVVGLVLVSLVVLNLNGNITGRASFLRSCTDSDNGKNPYVAGIAVVKTLTSKEPREFADTCNNKKSVLEHYCDGTVRMRETINCPMGCKDGACLPIR